jgi:hypothetical protein
MRPVKMMGVLIEVPPKKFASVVFFTEVPSEQCTDIVIFYRSAIRAIYEYCIFY